MPQAINNAPHYEIEGRLSDEVKGF